MARQTIGKRSHCCLTIRYRSPPDARGNTRMVVLSIAAPLKIDPAEVDLLEALIPLTMGSASNNERGDLQ